MIFKSHCGGCAAAKPVFEKVATKFAAENHEMKFVAISMTSGDKIIQKFGVTKFPTFLYFSGLARLIFGNFEKILGGNLEFEYFGAKKEDKIEEFCRNPVFIERPKVHFCGSKILLEFLKKTCQKYVFRPNLDSQLKQM